MKATYVSVWDGDIEIRTKCEYDPETMIVTDIESVNVNNLECLDDVYIELPSGEEVRKFIEPDDHRDELTSEEIEQLKNIFK